MGVLRAAPPEHPMSRGQLQQAPRRHGHALADLKRTSGRFLERGTPHRPSCRRTIPCTEIRLGARAHTPTAAHRPGEVMLPT